MEHTLVAEFPPLGLDASDGDYLVEREYETNYEEIGNGIFVSKTVIDLTGYQLSDSTVFFRSSFEQAAGIYGIYWSPTLDPISSEVVPMRPTQLGVMEQVIVSTVPLSTDNLLSLIFSSPGFNQRNTATLPFGDFGSFNRTHIIHGNMTLHGIQTTIADPMDSLAGYSPMGRIVSEHYSSLEPTTADRLFCYRYFDMIGPAYNEGADIGGVSNFFAPALRVILPIVATEEPWLEYMMRQKRGYELANQV